MADDPRIGVNKPPVSQERYSMHNDNDFTHYTPISPPPEPPPAQGFTYRPPTSPVHPPATSSEKYQYAVQRGQEVTQLVTLAGVVAGTLVTIGTLLFQDE